MEVERLVVGPVRTNCYLLHDKGQCIIIDPGGDPDKIIKMVKQRNFKPTLILATHGHFDHVLSVDVLRGEFGVPFLINNKDEPLLQSFNEHARLFLGLDPGSSPKPDGGLSTGNILQVGEEELEVMETPGHTAGSTTFVTSDSLFTGDFLFAGSIGRTDVGGSDFEMRNTLRKILALSKDYKVYPGHGNFSTLNYEKKNNGFLNRDFLNF